MSFRLFIYYCALCGAWAGLLGWALGTLLAPSSPGMGRDCLMGLALGLCIALGLGLVDAFWNLGSGQIGKILMRGLVALVIGALGGLLGGLLGNVLVNLAAPLFIVGWTFAGTLVGASVGGFELLASLFSGKDVGSSTSKLVKCLIGGTIGGVLGGGIALVMIQFGAGVLNKPITWLWSPTATGFVALGACIGLLVALAQVILKEAWIKVEAGFRPGRELILAKETTVVGRAEGSDIALFGDNGVEKQHAFIVQQNGNYFLEDQNTPGGTFVNDQPARGRVPLKNGDLIRMGRSQLRFSEKQKKRA